MKKLLISLLLPILAFAQTNQPTPLRVLYYQAITSDFIIDNRSQVNRQLDYVSVACVGSGSWQVDLEYSSASAGPWTNFGSGASVTEASSVPIAYGFKFVPPNYIRVNVVSGAPTCDFSGSKNYFVSSAAGSVSFPLAINQGGTGATTQPQAQLNLIKPPLLLEVSPSGTNWPKTVFSTTNTAKGRVGSVTGVTSEGRVDLLANLDFNNTGGTWSLDDTAQYGAAVSLRSDSTAANPSLRLRHFTPGSNPRTPTDVLCANYNNNVLVGTCTDDSSGNKLQVTGNIGATGNLIGTLSGNSTQMQNSRTNLGINVTGVLTGNGTSITGVTGNGNTVLRRKANTSGFEMGQAQMTSNKEYQFSYSVGGASDVSVDLTSFGLKTATFTPCPLGVAGTDSNHYLYISGGTGTAENVLITGGTCTSGASSGTLIFATANNHSGSWTITSSSAGVREAFEISKALNGNAFAQIYVPQGTYELYAETFFDVNTTIVGDGSQASKFKLMNRTMNAFTQTNAGTSYTELKSLYFQPLLDANYQTAGWVLGCGTNATCVLSIDDVYTKFMYTVMYAVSTTFGSAAYISNSEFHATVNSVLIYSGVQPGLIRLNYVYADGRFVSNNVAVNSTVNTSGTTVTRVSGDVFTPLLVGQIIIINNLNYRVASVDNANQITLTASAGVTSSVALTGWATKDAPILFDIQGLVAGATISNMWLQAAEIHFRFNTTVERINEVIMSNVLMDQDIQSTAAIYAVGSSGTASSASSNIWCTGCYIAASGYGILATDFSNIRLSDSYVRAQITYPAITLSNVYTAKFTNNHFIRSIDYGNQFAIDIQTPSFDLDISGNTFYSMTGFVPGTGTLPLAIRDVGSSSTMTVMNNTLKSVTTLITSGASNSGFIVVRNNVDPSAAPSIASASTITLPAYDENLVVSITGTTTVNTINGGGPQRSVKFYCPSGLTFSAAGNIATAVTASAGQLIIGTFSTSTSKWYLK